MKPTLFLLQMPFEDGPGKLWFCSDCALIEGALAVNPQWEDEVEVCRIGFPKPRKELIKILGEERQWLPVLVRPDGVAIDKPLDILNYLSQTFGGAAPHP